jgi:hypothetical protein
MASLEDFAKRMTRISVQVENGVEQGVRDCADAVARSVIGGTPADTGRARSNWTVQMDEAYKGLFPARVPGSGGSTAEENAAAAVQAAEAEINGFHIDKHKSIHITNNLPYIGRLNDGHSEQAPKDFVRIAALAGLAAVRGLRVLKD